MAKTTSGLGTNGSGFNKAEIHAIEGYTALGGQYESKYPFTAKDSKILEQIANDRTEVSVGLFRKIDVSESTRDKMFDDWYNGKTVDVNFSRYQGFTEDKTRAHTFGGKKGEPIMYYIPSGEKIHGVDIQKQSIYSIEKEHLIGSNNRFYISDWGYIDPKSGKQSTVPIVTIRVKK